MRTFCQSMRAELRSSPFCCLQKRFPWTWGSLKQMNSASDLTVSPGSSATAFLAPLIFSQSIITTIEKRRVRLWWACKERQLRVSFPSDKCRLHLQLRGREKVASRKNVSKFSFSDLRVKKKKYTINCCNPFLLLLDAGWSNWKNTCDLGDYTWRPWAPTPRFPEDSGLSHLRGMLKETFYTWLELQNNKNKHVS